MQRSRTPTLVIIVIIIAFGLLMGLNILQRSAHAGKVKVAVYVLPDGAKLNIRGQQYGNGTAYLAPGTYSITAQVGGYADYSGKFTVDPSIKKPVLDVIMTPTSDAAKTYYANNQSLVQQRQSIGANQSHQQSSLIFKKSPIVSQLPYDDLLYTIGYQADPADPSGQAIIIDITADEGFRNAAVNQIRKLGYDPTDFKISFEDYANPFTTDND